MTTQPAATTFEPTFEIALLARRTFSPTNWCAACGAEVAFVTPGEAAAMACTDLRTLFLWAEMNTVHLKETPNGAQLVCLDSLLA
jgi:hypothetical protein